MKINFRQGIVSYPESTGGQTFLQVPVAGTVNIIGEVSVALAHRDADYLHTEVNTVAPAWTSVPTSGDAWLYWDIDTKTAAVTYGHTTVQPVSQSTQPGTLVSDLHWFDTVTNIHKVYDGTRFLERIRVFAARINGTQLFPMGSNTASPYAGTQIGNNNITFAGQILFAGGLPVIVNTSNSFSPPAFGRAYTFATTETEFVTGGAQKVNTIRLESDFTTAAAAQNLAAYDIVKYNSAGRLEPAGYNDTTSTTIGIITDDAAINSLATVILQGVVTNEQWNWTTIGAELFILNDGELTDVDPNLTTPSLYPESKPPVARVLNSKEIIFMQGLGKVGPRGLPVEELNSIGDVEIDNVVIGQVLTYTGSPALWRNSDAVNSFEGLSDTAVGSPTANDFVQYDGTNWVNQTRRQANLGYFGVEPILRAGSPVFFQNDDAGKGVISTGSPIGTTNTWRVPVGNFSLGDVITLNRRPSTRPVDLEAGPNVQILSAFDANTITGGSPHSTVTLGNPSQGTLWLIELAGSPTVGSPTTAYDVWMLNGSNLTFN
jgi:hypothetical protein